MNYPLDSALKLPLTKLEHENRINDTPFTSGLEDADVPALGFSLKVCKQSSQYLFILLSLLVYHLANARACTCTMQSSDEPRAVCWARSAQIMKMRTPWTDRGP